MCGTDCSKQKGIIHGGMCRYKKYAHKRKQMKERARQLRHMLASLVPRAALGGQDLDVWGASPAAKQLAFVVTDIEASTAQAAQDAVAYSHAQEIHDTVCSAANATSCCMP